jgi:hypothetical protein
VIAAVIAEIWSIVIPISLIALTASPVVACISVICSDISWVAVAVLVASSLTPDAMTANPLPASPARAASIVAFNARRLVWPAIALINVWTVHCATLEGMDLRKARPDGKMVFGGRGNFERRILSTR